jgi:hypothetical protein
VSDRGREWLERPCRRRRRTRGWDRTGSPTSCSGRAARTDADHGRLQPRRHRLGRPPDGAVPAPAGVVLPAAALRPPRDRRLRPAAGQPAAAVAYCSVRCHAAGSSSSCTTGTLVWKSSGVDRVGLVHRVEYCEQSPDTGAPGSAWSSRTWLDGWAPTAIRVAHRLQSTIMAASVSPERNTASEAAGYSASALTSARASWRWACRS